MLNGAFCLRRGAYQVTHMHVCVVHCGAHAPIVYGVPACIFGGKQTWCIHSTTIVSTDVHARLDVSSAITACLHSAPKRIKS
jgi:hypothetical protein